MEIKKTGLFRQKVCKYATKNHLHKSPKSKYTFFGYGNKNNFIYFIDTKKITI